MTFISVAQVGPSLELVGDAGCEVAHGTHIVKLTLQSSLQGMVPLTDSSQWMQLVEDGLHLGYRLWDCFYTDGLPHLSLALIYIALLWSLRTAQSLNTGTLHPDHGPSHEEQQIEPWLCFEECTMKYGPDCLGSIMKPKPTGHYNQCDAQTHAYKMSKRQ